MTFSPATRLTAPVIPLMLMTPDLRIESGREGRLELSGERVLNQVLKRNQGV